jgi:polysaccharide deacetylase family protein (PEP-CTERM system associated)
MSGAPTFTNAMSVDVEDYFQVSAFESVVDRDKWDDYECRVERNMDRILELFEARDVKATFFTLGWIAERYPEMTRRIVEEGHELASHGWSHVRANTQNPQEFAEDVSRSRSFLEDVGGVAVKGYRAASYSIGSANMWALDVLADAGYSYSSSIVPVNHDHYGMPDAPRFPFRAANDRLLEIPISTISIANRNLNCGGGGWFRLFPYSFQRWALRQVNEQEGQPGIFYFHPWEIDTDQPRPAGLSLKSRFRHYLNIDKMYSRLDRLLQDFQWGRMDDVFLGGAEAACVVDDS